MKWKEYFLLLAICLTPLLIAGPIDKYFNPSLQRFLIFQACWSMMVASLCYIVSRSYLSISIMSIELIAAAFLLTVSIVYFFSDNALSTMSHVVLNFLTMLELILLCAGPWINALRWLGCANDTHDWSLDGAWYIISAYRDRRKEEGES